MNNNGHANPYKPILLFLTLSFLINAGCQHVQTVSQGGKSPAHNIKKICLIGFKPSVYQGDEADDNSAHMPHDTSPADTELLEKSHYMTSKLIEVTRVYKEYELIGPDRAGEMLTRVNDSEPGINNLKTAGRIASGLQADAALIGYLYRWKDREGSDYAIKYPASVFFDLYLVSPDDGSILWKGRFNKTQRSLNENLLDIRTFLKGKGKWMTADDLAVLGLDDLVNELFLYLDKGKEVEN
jgi:hypothetical protein